MNENLGRSCKFRQTRRLLNEIDMLMVRYWFHPQTRSGHQAAKASFKPLCPVTDHQTRLCSHGRADTRYLRVTTLYCCYLCIYICIGNPWPLTSDFLKLKRLRTEYVVNLKYSPFILFLCKINFKQMYCKILRCVCTIEILKKLHYTMILYPAGSKEKNKKKKLPF